MSIWLETVNEMEPEVRKLYLHEVKLTLELTMSTIARTLEYEKLRLSLIGDVEVVVLEGDCNKCKKPVVVHMKIVDYYESHAHVSLVLMKCPVCNSPQLTLKVPQLWNISRKLYNIN